jgi:hypothetical protein
MKQDGWQTCQNPAEMLQFLLHRKAVSRRAVTLQRKLRLFACGCCRRVWHLLPEGPYRRAVEAAEGHADGREHREALEVAGALLRGVRLPYEPLTAEKLQRAVASATFLPDRAGLGPFVGSALRTAWEVGEVVTLPPAALTAAGPQSEAYLAGRRSPAYLTEQRLRADLVRDVIPSPFEPVRFDSAWLAWRHDTVVNLARSIYDEHRLADLLILADALEEAGCDNPEVLAHCRGPGPHLRGCWVLDLLLGKE